MFHSGVSRSCVDNNNHHTHNTHTGARNGESIYSNPNETALHLDTLAGVRLRPRVRLTAGGEREEEGQSTADVVSREEYASDPAHSANRRDQRDVFERSHGRPISSTAPSSFFSPDTQQTPHELKPYIPIPTPFEYADDDGDDFRGYFDFDQAWARGDSDPNSEQLERSRLVQDLSESPQLDSPPGLSSSSPSSTGSGTSCGTILTPKTPYHDQEYYDLMYKLDLGAESPYLGSAYVEAFGARGCQIYQPPPSPPARSSRDDAPSVKDRVKGNADSSSTNSNADAAGAGTSSKHDTHCSICLRKAASPCRTSCCNKTFCRAHITEWLKSKESSGLCPSCDTVCVLPPVVEESSLETASRKRRGPSRSHSPVHSRTSSSTSTASTASSSSSSSSSSTSSVSPLCTSESGSSTRVNNARSKFSSSATLVLGDSSVNVGAPLVDEDETEDLWDVKSAWKKNGGESLNFAKMAREVTSDVINGSMKFVGLSGGVRAGARTSGSSHRSVAQPGTTTVVEKGFNLSPKELVKEVSGFALGLGGWGDMTEMGVVDEIGEVGVAKRMLSIVGLVVVLFVLFR